MLSRTTIQPRPVWGTPQLQRSIPRINIPGFEPRGGGLLTLLVDLWILFVCFALTGKLLAQDSMIGFHKEPLCQVGLIMGLWFFLGSWRTPHAVFLSSGAVRGITQIGWNYLQTLAIACMVFNILPGESSMEDGIVLATMLFIGASGLLAVRFVELKIVGWIKTSTRHRHRILFVGNNERTQRILNHLRMTPQCRIEVVGLLDSKEANPAKAIDSGEIRYMGPIDMLPSFLYGGMVDEVVITLPVRSRYQESEKVLKTCSDAGIRAHVFSDIFNIGEPRRELSDLGGNQTVTYARGPAPTYRLMIKRNLDLALSILGIILLGPLLLAIALAIKLTSPGPVFFRQARSGLNGRIFRVLKFRTMCVDAERKKKALLDHNEVSGPVFKMRHDPRITVIGRFLRKYSLDELPQLFNVISGEMSLVGPRPPIPEEVKNYNFWQLRRLSMRPGLTCFWQVFGRNKTSFEEWMRLDLRYIDNWSLTLDFMILLRTIPTVLRGTGM